MGKNDEPGAHALHAGSKVARLAPESLEAGARVIGAAVLQAGDEQQRIDRAGTRPADGVEFDAVLEQTVEHAPGEGAERASSLKRKGQPLLALSARPGALLGR